MSLDYLFRYFSFLVAFLLFQFVSLNAFSQTQPNITGEVYDQDGTPVYMANVVLKGTPYHTETDTEGHFTLSVPPGKYELEITRVGFKAEKTEITVGITGLKLGRKVLTNSAVQQEVQVSGKTKAQVIKEQGFQVNAIDLKAQYNTTSDLNQVLNRTTGVRIREEGGLGSNFNFSLNGFSGNQVKFFLDGIPMDNFGSSFTLNNLPVNIAERIEVYKGVVPVGLGTDALGGAVNIITRSNKNYLDVSYSVGSFNTHRPAISAGYYDPKTHFTVRANAFYNYSDNNYKVRVEPIDFETNQKLPARDVKRFHDNYESAGGQIEVGVSGTSYADKLLLGLLASGNDKDVQTGVTMEQVYGKRTTKSNTIIPTLKYQKYNFLAKGLDLNLYSAYNISNNRFIDTSRYRYNWLRETQLVSNGGRGEQGFSLLKNKDHEALITANLSYKLNDHHAFTYNYILSDFTRKSSDAADPDKNLIYEFPQGVRKQNMGISWQATYGAFTANVFGKAYLFKAKSAENVSTNLDPVFQVVSTNKNYLGYGAASAYYLLPQLQVKASYEKAYRMPDASEILGDGLYVIANPRLNPESSHNFNVGAIYTAYQSASHRVDIEGNFIYRNARDYIRPFQGQNQPTGRQLTNVGKVVTTGVEGEIRYSWKRLIYASVNATYQNIVDSTQFLKSSNLSGTIVTKNQNYGYRLPNIPYLFGNFNLGAQIPDVGAKNNRLGINYSLNVVQNYYLTPNQLGAGNDDEIPRQIAHNVSADYSLRNGKYNVSLECRNLTDNLLYDNFRLQKPGRSVWLKLRYFITK
ncbi:TonB-dependent receptor domain-containing protein [Mucilaginibacter litoreus]|uniref:TonB-dependent receptor domain-containing protein n=1 Tax=Mucilaginibacter litoreus TaxID=1048221 RepID=A0ABW3AXL7_9SPHI